MLLIALLDTGVPVWALDSERVEGPLGIRASVAGGFLNLTPLFAIAAAYVLLGERLTQSQWIGAITILLSVFALLTWSGPSRARVSIE